MSKTSEILELNENIEKYKKCFKNADSIKINPDMSLNVEGDVCFNGEGFSELPFKFDTVDGFFKLNHCKNLVSLKGIPTKYVRSLLINVCRKLESLEGLPKEIGVSLILDDVLLNGENIQLLGNLKRYKDLRVVAINNDKMYELTKRYFRIREKDGEIFLREMKDIDYEQDY